MSLAQVKSGLSRTVRWLWVIGRTRNSKVCLWSNIFWIKVSFPSVSHRRRSICKIQAEVLPELSLLTNQVKIMNNLIVFAPQAEYFTEIYLFLSSVNYILTFYLTLLNFLRYNSHTIRFTLLKRTILWFQNICDIVKSSLLIPEHFLYPPPKKPIPISRHPPFSPSLVLGNPSSTLCDYGFPYSGISYKWNHTTWRLLCLA